MGRGMISFRSLLAPLAAVALCASPAAAEKAPAHKATLTDGALTVDIVDLSPRFLAWYAAAKDAPDADTRFKLWKALYDFAAVPPTPQGDAIARRLVDGAWPRYAQALAPATAGADGMQPKPMAILHKVADTLGLKAPGHIQLITYVGGFEDNAFSYRGELPTVAVPLESDPEVRKLILAHEGAHAVHMIVGGLSGGWERSVAATMLQEGVAMHATREVFPGLPTAIYVTHDAAWLNARSWRTCAASSTRAIPPR